jgi:hypothetical protein
MLSIPPATMMSLLPTAIRSWASIVAFIAEPHILLIVVQPASQGMPAPWAAWRAGAWPWPAGSTQPMMTSSTSVRLAPDPASAPRTATAPSAGAATSFRLPCRPPIGVRAAPVMTIGSLSLMVSPPMMPRA